MSMPGTRAAGEGCAPFLEAVRRIRDAEARPIDAANFCATLSVNVDNDRLSDREFREFVRRTLPAVDFPRPAPRNR